VQQGGDQGQEAQGGASARSQAAAGGGEGKVRGKGTQLTAKCKSHHRRDTMATVVILLLVHIAGTCSLSQFRQLAAPLVSRETSRQ
jgi:hypothetical protein